MRSALAQGDVARAVAAARKALTLMKTLEGTASLVPIVNVPIAEALMRAEGAAGSAPKDLETLCADALHQEELLGQIDAAKTLRADALRCMGDALMLEGRPIEALAPLERSLTIPRRTYPGDLARARFALARALVLAGGDAARANASRPAGTRRQASRAAPGPMREVEIVERWLEGASAKRRRLTSSQSGFESRVRRADLRERRGRAARPHRFEEDVDAARRPTSTFPPR